MDKAIAANIVQNIAEGAFEVRRVAGSELTKDGVYGQALEFTGQVKVDSDERVWYLFNTPGSWTDKSWITLQENGRTVWDDAN